MYNNNNNKMMTPPLTNKQTILLFTNLCIKKKNFINLQNPIILKNKFYYYKYLNLIYIKDKIFKFNSQVSSNFRYQMQFYTVESCIENIIQLIVKIKKNF